MKKYVTTVNILTLANSPEEALEIALKKKDGARLDDVLIYPREFLNDYNEDSRNIYIKATNDLPLFKKIVRAVALARVVWTDPQLDGLCERLDDGDGTDLLSEYNDGFNQGAMLTGRDPEQAFQDLLIVTISGLRNNLERRQKGESHDQ